MKIHLIDGTYELFRHFFALPPGPTSAVRGVLVSILGMIRSGTTHLGVATDHVIESFRNHLYAGYKTGEGVAPELLAQFPLLEEALDLMGVKVWPMVEYEADDALASAAVKAAQDPRAEQVLICTPDKDLSQCVSGARIVQLDRRHGTLRNEDGVIEKFGVKPESIPDYLALVGDSADGFPGLPGWGPKAAAQVLSQYPHLEDIPKDWRHWSSSIRAAQRLASVLFTQWNDALLYRLLATLRTDVPVFDSIDELEWKGPKPGFEAYCRRLEAPELYERATSPRR